KMIQITAQMRVLVAIEPVDGRKGIDSLAQLCREKLTEDPFSGCVFIFRSRSGTSIRLLSYDGQGCWLAQKRLSKGRFRWWPEASGAAKAIVPFLDFCPATRGTSDHPSRAASHHTSTLASAAQGSVSSQESKMQERARSPSPR